eukprot:TRINITY_DN56391_c0_g1_i1.p1 TRINITY_DN56391_c0_g1~~TRINITY_DN56391_c0_g1_i1.p1  ORF type:complete len:270 (+),score=9.98 TRINITY_DN56391_c0_g1_i1:1-810(+)
MKLPGRLPSRVIARPIGVIRTQYPHRGTAPRQPGFRNVRASGQPEHLLSAPTTIQLFSFVQPSLSLRDLSGFDRVWLISLFHLNRPCDSRSSAKSARSSIDEDATAEYTHALDTPHSCSLRAEPRPLRLGEADDSASEAFTSSEADEVVFRGDVGWKPLVRVPRAPRPRRGVYGTRSPHRPNHLALSCVQLLHVDPVRGLLLCGPSDLVDGTPLLDIKPYVPTYDAFPDAAIGWLADAPSVAADAATGTLCGTSETEEFEESPSPVPVP